MSAPDGAAGSAKARTLARIMAWREDNRDKVLAHKRRYYQRHKAQYAEWKKANPERVRASRRRHAAKDVARAKAWSIANPELARAMRRKSEARSRETVSLAYVRKLVAGQYGWPLAKALPKAFLQTKASIIKIKRICHDHPTSKN